MLTEWSGAAVEPGGGKPTAVDWEPVSVPGRPAAFAGADCVAYRTTFPDPRDPDEAMAMVVLRGLWAHGRVWLNDEFVAESDAVFEPVHVPFEPDDENELVVECRRPDDRYGGVHDTDRVPDADAVPGIWWDATLSTHPRSFVVDVRPSPRLSVEGDRDGAPDGEAGEVEAAIDATVEVYAGDPLDDRLTLTTKPAGERRGRGMMDRVGVEAMDGERVTVETTIQLRDPSLWWPRGLGAQSRYEVRAKLDDAVASATTGLASITETEDGLAVNGRPLTVRGVTLEDASVADVERAVEVNANLVRAHAHALPDEVYRACDEAGLLVWQDLPLTGEGLFDIGRGQDLAERLAAATAGHPSLAAFGVHDDPAQSFTDRLGGGFLDRLRFRWRTWRTDYDRGAAEAVADAFPDSRPVYPVIGEPGTHPDAAAIYPGWDYGEADDVEWLLDRYDLWHAVGEFGAGALGTADPVDLAGFDRAKHDAAVPGGDVEASQAHQADVLRTVADHLRVDGTPTLVVRALRDTGDAGMGVYTRDGDRKAAADALAAAFEPIQAFLPDPGAGETDAVVVNDGPESVAGTLSWTAGDAEGAFDVEVAPGESVTAGSVTVPSDAESVALTLETDAGTVERGYPL